MKNKLIDDFLNDFSSKEELKNKVQEEARLKKEKEIQLSDKFKLDFDKLFKKTFKPKLDELKVKLTNSNFTFEYDKVIRQNQSDQLCFDINITKQSFPKLEIKVIAYISTRKISFRPKSSDQQTQLGFKNYEFQLDEFNHILDLFELTLVEIFDVQF